MPSKPTKSNEDSKSIQRKKQLGKNISTLRKKAGFESVIDLTIETDQNASQVGRWEAGKGNPTFLNICKLADALGVSPSEVLKGIE